ncbi:Sodium / potassium ATPase beta chain [Trichostrongylus colubriformis]|uniref:Sodium / potassium ATPase beta chain n=1 Tax=Trichostrongylus colubriformis TaxID=6319 RepID=A0AAN8GEK8_TRICO
MICLAFEPNPSRFDVRTRGVIQFRSKDPNTYHNLMVRYKKLLKDEYNNTKIAKPKCTNIEGAHDGAPTNVSVCHVEAGSSKIYGDCALTIQNINKGMGFGSGEPCIMLRLSKMFGWYPSDHTVSKERKCGGNITNCCDRKRLQFSCKIVEGTATIEMLPKDGISLCAFPFWNKPGYEQPFFMLKLTDLESGKTEIKCEPQQKSIQRLDGGEENALQIIIEKLD